MLHWIDAHNHLHDHRFSSPEELIGPMKQTGISRCITNATCEEDWDAVENLSRTHPDFVLPALGIHPWKAHLCKAGWENRLKQRLENNPQAGIGECGLDGWISHPPLETQQSVFLAHLRLARELQRPLTIHCLKAWQPLFDAFTQEPPPEKFLMHSFGGSLEIACRLLPLGTYFSFSGYFLHPRKAKVLDVFRELPKDRILLETDAPDMLPPPDFITHPLEESLNHPANLPAIAQGLAGHLNLSLEELSELTLENSRRFHA
ncbi:MAG: TatD family hydrolase [Luteolibacter sp.]